LSLERIRANANTSICFRGSSHALRPRLHTWRISTIVDPTGSPIQGHTCPISRDVVTPPGAH